MFNLPAIDTIPAATSGVKMPIILPNGSTYMQSDGKTPRSLTLLGADAPAWRAASMEVTRKRVDRGANNDGFEQRMADAEEDALSVLVAATVGWDGIVDSKDKPVPFTPENVRQLYTQYPAIRDQAEAFIGKRANFTPRS
jgi:hypothetical protein